MGTVAKQTRHIPKTTYTDKNGKIILDKQELVKIYNYTFEEAQQMVGQYIRQANIINLERVYMLFSDFWTFENEEHVTEFVGKLEYIGREDPDLVENPLFKPGWLRYYLIPDEWR